MSSAACWPEELFDRFAHPLQVVLQSEDGWSDVLEPPRWHHLSEGDHFALEGVCGPVLDVGCGPGRHLAALQSAGVEALGIDTSAAAVAEARRNGIRAEVASVFDFVPGTGRWATVLLLDGNIGIGGDPTRLLTRCRQLVRPGGGVIVETGAPGTASRRGRVRVVTGSTRQTDAAGFPWATVPATRIEAHGQAAGLQMVHVRSCGGRWFAFLRRAALEALDRAG